MKTALSLAEFVIAKLNDCAESGMEKFLNITCREAKIKPDMVILATFVNELNHYGGATEEKMFDKSLVHLEKGIQYLMQDIEIVKKFGIPVLVNASEYREITKDEVKLIDKYCSNLGVKTVFSQIKNYNIKAGLEFVKSVLETIRVQKSYFKPLYDLNLPIREKMKIISKEVYGNKKINYSLKAESQINHLERAGYGNLPVCITRAPCLKKSMDNSELNIKELVLYAGANIIVAISEDAEFMPYFSKKFNVERLKNVVYK